MRKDEGRIKEIREKFKARSKEKDFNLISMKGGEKFYVTTKKF
jgi:hypothetical protein